MRPPLRTDQRIAAERVSGDIVLKDRAILCDGKPLRVEVLDALVVDRGSRITATALASIIDSGCSIAWTAPGGIVSFTPARRTSDAQFVEHQARCATHKGYRLQVARRMMRLRFGESPPQSYSLNEIRGWEGRRMAALFRSLSDEYDIEWNGRSNDPRGDFSSIDEINRELSSRFSRLYREVHLAVLVMGMSPSLGIIHSGDPRSFVYDAADIYKNEVARLAFQWFAGEDIDVPSCISEMVRTRFVRDMRECLWD